MSAHGIEFRDCENGKSRRTVAVVGEGGGSAAGDA